MHRFKKNSGFSYDEMLFFDDEYRNIVDITKIGKQPGDTAKRNLMGIRTADLCFFLFFENYLSFYSVMYKCEQNLFLIRFYIF